MIVGIIMIVLLIIYRLYAVFTRAKKKHSANRTKKTHKKNTLPVKDKRKAHGVIFGRLTPHGRRVMYAPTKGEAHVAVFGGSGTGKTSAILIPTLQSWDGTSLVIDISGDISAAVDMPNMLLFDPDNADTMPYNIFGMIDNMDNADDQDDALEKIANILIPQLEGGNSAALYFQNGGRRILTAALIAFYHAGLDFVEICQKICSMDYSSLFSAIDNSKNARASMYISGFAGGNEQNITGCYDNCTNAIRFFATRANMKRCLKRPKKDEICITPDSTATHNVFLCISDANLELYSSLVRVITAQCLDFFAARSNNNTNKILFALDEFASLGWIDIVPPLRKYRKKGITIMIITQSLADLLDIYGKEKTDAILSNTALKVILSASDVNTQKYFADLIGKDDVCKNSYSDDGALSSPASVRETVSTEQRYRIEPQELAVLGDELILLYPGGYERLYKNYYFKK